jgi:hypothetical protein
MVEIGIAIGIETEIFRENFDVDLHPDPDFDFARRGACCVATI